MTIDAIGAAKAGLVARLTELESEIERIYDPAKPLEAEATQIRAAIRGLDAVTAGSAPVAPRLGVQSAPTPCPHCGREFRGQGGMLVHIKKCPDRPKPAVSTDPPAPALGPRPVGLSRESLNGTVLRCACGEECPSPADLFGHCRDVHGRQPTNAERTPVPV